MTQGNENNLLATLMQMVNEDGLEAVAETFRILLNEAMKIERDQSLGAGLYERTDINWQDRSAYNLPCTVKIAQQKVISSFSCELLFEFAEARLCRWYIDKWGDCFYEISS